MAQDPYRYFRVEAAELVEQLGKGVLDLEKGATPEVASRLLRLAHTLKGAARVVKQREIADLAHAIEGALAPLRALDGPPASARDMIEKVLGLIDAIAARLSALGAPEPVSAPAAPLATPALQGQPEGRGVPGAEAASPAPPVALADESFPAWHAPPEDMDALLLGVSQVGVQLGAVRRATSGLERLRHFVDLLSGQPGGVRAAGVPGAAHAPGVIAVAASRAQPLVEDLRGMVAALSRELSAGMEQADRELLQVRQAAERIRLLPATRLFHPLERTARDAAHALAKRVSFMAEGGEVRLDPQIIAAVQSALVQLVRNAVAHGIETPAERAASGKPPEGRVSLHVTRHGSRLSFVCSDDGRGVDLEAVRRAAERAGIAQIDAKIDAKTGTKIDTRTDAGSQGKGELLRLLLRGGLTTSGTITEVAGRGIGLDVVRDAANRLGGEVSMRTEEGRGTTIELTVPVSLSGLRALVVEAAGQAAAIPLDGVRRTVRLAPEDLARTATGESILFEGAVIPFAPLARSLRQGDAKAHHDRAPGARAWSAVVVAAGSGLAAVGVDRLLGTETVVLRPLPALARADASVAGACLDAEGNPRIVLDAEGLVAAIRGLGAHAAPTPAPPLPILVIDDSLTTRMLEQSILESAGYVVDTAVSAEQGLEKAHRRRYALFLVDVEMPGMDGYSFIERTRADPALRDIPAILVTSRGSPEDRRRGEEVGARAYIVKSEFDQGALLDRIRALVA